MVKWKDIQISALNTNLCMCSFLVHNFPQSVISYHRYGSNYMMAFNMSKEISGDLAALQMLPYVSYSLSLPSPECRADSRLVSSQWETSLQRKAVVRWPGANLESALEYGEVCPPRQKSMMDILKWPVDEWHTSQPMGGCSYLIFWAHMPQQWYDL